MEPQELSPALLQAQITMVATLGELLDTLPSLIEMNLLLRSAARLYQDLEKFTKVLWSALYSINTAWGHYNVISNDDGDPVTSLSQALAAYRSTPGTTLKRVTMAASKWQGLVTVLVDRWAQVAKKATELRNTCREVAAEVHTRRPMAGLGSYRMRVPMVVALRQTLWAMVTPWAEMTQDEWIVRLEAQRGEEASEARRATMVRQQLEAALGLLERLVAACDEATAFPRELHHLLGDIEGTLEGTNGASPNVPEALVAKVAEAERLWEASARLAKDHLEGTVDDILKFYFTKTPTSLNAREVAERCQRAIEDIPRLVRPSECPQSVAKVSPVSMEPQEVRQGGEGDRRDSGGDTGVDGGWQQGQEADKGTEGEREPLRGTGPLQEATNPTRSLTRPQLQALVAVVATLGEVVATVTGPHREKSPDSLHEDLKNFTQRLRAILNHGGVTSLGHHVVPSLGRTLATLGATPGSTWADVRAAAKAWQKLVARLVDSWDWLAREATKLYDHHRKVVVEQQLMVALDKEEVTREMATHDAQVAAATNEAMGEAVVAPRRGHWAVVALGLLQRLVGTCDRATLFSWNMEWQVRDIKAILKGTNKASPDVVQALVAKVAKFEWLWDASTRLAKEHLLGTLGDIHDLLLCPCGGPGGSGSRAVAERCQRAIEDIPRLLQESFT